MVETNYKHTISLSEIMPPPDPQAVAAREEMTSRFLKEVFLPKIKEGARITLEEYKELVVGFKLDNKDLQGVDFFSIPIVFTYKKARNEGGGYKEIHLALSSLYADYIVEGDNFFD